ncbi:hypothetical protein, partial [Akkermansia sp. BIOML-A56]|uniref:hypothetical protein n=1 Tax=Akkermansia sp. BIOML-A56 TaxID=2584612 RepID=UPI001960D17B
AVLNGSSARRVLFVSFLTPSSFITSISAFPGIFPVLLSVSKFPVIAEAGFYAFTFELFAVMCCGFLWFRIAVLLSILSRFWPSFHPMEIHFELILHAIPASFI